METPIEPTPSTTVTSLAEKASWEATSVLKGVRYPLASDLSFDEVIQNRRSRRVFDPVDLRETRGFIQHIFSKRLVGKGNELGRIRKSFISAGALHPIDVIILSGPNVDEPILFDDKSGKFLTLPILDHAAFVAAVLDANILLPTAEGHLILLVGDGRRVSASYLKSESLLWRDAGAALQACSMAAHAYGYAFCPLGQTGVSVLQSLGPPHKDYVALSMAMFGR